jgi:hypothetical protein
LFICHFQFPFFPNKCIFIFIFFFTYIFFFHNRFNLVDSDTSVFSSLPITVARMELWLFLLNSASITTAMILFLDKKNIHKIILYY